MYKIVLSKGLWYHNHVWCPKYREPAFGNLVEIDQMNREVEFRLWFFLDERHCEYIDYAVI